MYTLLTSLILTALVITVPLLFGASVSWTILPGIIVGVAAFIWINRRVAKRVEAVTRAADTELQGLQAIAQRAQNPMQAKQAQIEIGKHFDNAINVLKQGFLFAKWQVGVSTMLNARIGILYYTRWISLQHEASGPAAIPYLERSQLKGRQARLLQALWPAWAMLAIAYYKIRKDTAKALQVLEETTKNIKKEGLLWSIYAYILCEEKRTAEAIEVLIHGKEGAPEDEVLIENLTALQNNKKMQMRGYGDMWFQFGLEKPKMPNMQPKMGHPRQKANGGFRR